MATATLPPLAAEKLLLPPTTDGRARFSRKAYHRLAEIGVLNRDSRVELIDGEIFMTSPIGPPQGSLISRLSNFFMRWAPETIDCRIQLPIVIRDHSEPEPDVALVRRRDDDYQREHPSPTDVILIVEVAQSSLAIDLGKKLRLYAAAGIPEYWVVDAAQKILVIHRDPAGLAYRDVKTFAVGSGVAPVAAPNCQLDLSWLFR